jgi:K+-sensing histidine kinase KdpD
VRTVNQITRRLPGRLIRTLASVAAVAVVTGAIELLKLHVPVLSLGVLYIFAVLPVAIAWGLAYAIPVSIGSMAAFNFLFLPPLYTFTLASSNSAAFEHSSKPHPAIQPL